MAPVTLRTVGRNGLLAAIGLGAVGLSTVVVNAVASRQFPGTPFATLSVWWTLSLSVGLCFAVLEAYLPKVLGDALLLGEDGRPIQALMARRVAVALTAIVALAAVTSPWTIQRWFDGSTVLLVLAVAYVVVLALQSFQRGVAVARGRFSAFASQMITDAGLRIAICLGLVVAGSATPQTVAGAIVLSGAMSLVVGSAFVTSWWTWSNPRTSLSWFPLLALFVAALGPSIMNNATVPWLSNQSDADPYAVGAFAGAVGLSRIPIMFVGAIYAPIIRPLVDASARGDHHGFRRTYRMSIALGAGLALTFAVAGWLVGPWAVSIYLGPQYTVAPGVAAVLALTSGIGLMGAGGQAAVVAQGRWIANPRASSIGLVGFALVLALLPSSPQLVAAVAGLVGIGLLVLVMMSHVTGASLVPGRAPDGRRAQKGSDGA